MEEAPTVICVTSTAGVHRLAVDAELVKFGNRWLCHLEVRQFSAATVRGYAYDLCAWPGSWTRR